MQQTVAVRKDALHINAPGDYSTYVLQDVEGEDLCPKFTHACLLHFLILYHSPRLELPALRLGHSEKFRSQAGKSDYEAKRYYVIPFVHGPGG